MTFTNWYENLKKEYAERNEFALFNDIELEEMYEDFCEKNNLEIDYSW